METKINGLRQVTGVLVMLFYANSVLSQSSFSFIEVDERRNIGLLTYDGSKKSIADSDTVSLKAFTYLSVGRIKRLSSVSNGCVYTLIEYPRKQFVLIKSTGKEQASSLPMEWKDADVSNLNICLTSEDQVVGLKNRRHLSKPGDSITVALLNIREQDVALFMYMAESIYFD